MLEKIIRMEKIKESFVRDDNKGHYPSDIMDIVLFMKYTIDVFNNIIDRQETLFKKVKKLEQKDSYYPTDEEIRDIKIGGTD